MGTLLRSGVVEVGVDAPLDAVWAIVADPTGVGDWSHETGRAQWVDGATRAVPGARFAGHNQLGRFRWTRISEIVRVDEGREIVWRTIPSRRYNDSTEWAIRVEPVDGGRTRIRQSFEVLKLGPILDRLLWLLLPPHRDRRPALAEDLRRIGDAAMRSRAAASA